MNNVVFDYFILGIMDLIKNKVNILLRILFGFALHVFLHLLSTEKAQDCFVIDLTLEKID
jgi:hypothetical protein